MTRPQVVGRYHLQQRLAESPLSSVFLATDKDNLRNVIIKFAHPRTSSGQPLEQLDTEVSALKLLRHPNLPRLLARGEDLVHGRFLVREYSTGRSLLDAADPIPHFLDIATGLCRVLGYIHARGYSHGQVSREHIILHPTTLNSSNHPIPSRNAPLTLVGCSLIQASSLRSPALGQASLTSSQTADLQSFLALLLDLLPSPPTIRKRDLDSNHDPDFSLLHENLSTLQNRLANSHLTGQLVTAADVFDAVQQATPFALEHETIDGLHAFLETAEPLPREYLTATLRSDLLTLHSTTPDTGDHRPHSYLLVGPQGSGKTTLINSILRSVERHAYPVVSIDFSLTPHTPLLHLRALASSPLPLDPSQAPAFRSTSFTVGEGTPRWDISKRFSTIAHLTDELLRGFSNSPNVVICDNIHCSDDDTLDVLERLLMSAASHRSLLLFSFRLEGPLAARLRRIIKAHANSQHVHTIELQSFSHVETLDLLAGVFGPTRELPSFADECHEISRGNPFFLKTLLGHLIDCQYIRGGPFNWAFPLKERLTPHRKTTLGDLVATSLTTLSTSHRSLLQYLALSESPCDLALLHQASGLPIAEIAASMEALSLHRSVVSHPGPTYSSYVIANELFRQVLSEGMSKAIRIARFRSLGVALERTASADDVVVCSQMGRYFLRAGVTDKGINYSIRAGDMYARVGALASAISHYRSVLDVLPDSESELRFDLLEKVALWVRQSGDLDQAERCYLEILLASRRRSDVRRESFALSHLGRILADRGDLQAARGFAEKALAARDEPQDAACRGHALLTLSIVAQKRGVHPDAVAYAEQARQAALEADDRLLFGLASNSLALGLVGLNAFDQAACHLDTWLVISEELGDLAAYTMALGNRGFLELERGNYSRAEELFHLTLISHQRLRLPWPHPVALINIAEMLYLRARPREALEILPTALQASSQVSRGEMIHYALLLIGKSHTDLAEYAEALQTLDRSSVLSHNNGASAAHALSALAIGEVECTLGRAQAGRRRLYETLAYALDASDSVVTLSALCVLAESLAKDPRLRPSQAPHHKVSAPSTQQDRLDLSLLRRLEAFAHQVPEHEDLVHLARIAHAEARDAKTPLARCFGLLAGGWYHYSAARFADSLDCSKEAVSIAAAHELARIELRCLLLLYRAHSASGHAEESHEALLRAERIASDGQLVMSLLEVRSLHALHERKHACRCSTVSIGEIRRQIEEIRTRDGVGVESEAYYAMDWREDLLASYGTPQPDGLGDFIRLPQENASHHSVATDKRSCAIRFLDSRRGSRSIPEFVGECSLTSDDDARQVIVREMLRVVADRVVLYLLEEDSTLLPAAWCGTTSIGISGEILQLRSVVEAIFDGSNEVKVLCIGDEPRLNGSPSVLGHHLISVLLFPLRVESRVVGALYLDSRAGGRLFQEGDVQAAREAAARIEAALASAWEREKVREERLLQQRSLLQTYRLDAILGESPAIRRVFRVLEAVIASDCNVLIVGESGTGKELAARAIHFSGRRKMGPFLPVDCGALQDSLVESELFGYRRGAFTGADADKKGLFEEADGGTLFLDEITNTSTLFQAKLLRALQSGEFRRIGDTHARTADVRIIAATNADLDAVLRAGRFREDLFYRLNVVTVTLPPLRERREDIPALAEHFAREFCSRQKVEYRGLGEAALRRLQEHSWPGNVRELRNAVESALVLSRDGAVRREFLPEAIRGGAVEGIRDLLRAGTAALGGAATDAGPGSADPSEAPEPQRDRPAGWLTEDERKALDAAEEAERIRGALSRSGGDKSRAAAILGWSRMTLYRKMQRHGIDYDTGRSGAAQG